MSLFFFISANLDLLNSLLFLTQLTLDLDFTTPDRTLPELIYECIVAFHGILPLIQSNKTKGEICTICETWYRKNLEQKETIIRNVFVFLLEKCLHVNGTVS